MLKVIAFLCLSLSFAKANDENLPQLRHNWLLRKYASPWSEVPPHDEYRKQWATHNEDKISTISDISKFLGVNEDREELITPAYESEILPYGDDAKNYKVGLPLPQTPKDGEAANFMCYVPTRRGMIVTHCGLADDEGTCPTTKSCGFVIPHFWSLPKLCLSDFDCPYEQKCCSHSCYQHKVCQHPISENKEGTVNHINIRQFINLNINKETPENIESLLNATLNDTNIDESLWNLTTTNSSSDYNLTVSYSHEVSRKFPNLNLSAANGSSEPTTNYSISEPATNSSDSEPEQTLNLTISNSTQEHSLPWNLTLTNSSKEYEQPISNLTFNSSKEHDLDVQLIHILPKANPFDPDAEIDEIENMSGSGSGDDGLY